MSDLRQVPRRAASVWAAFGALALGQLLVDIDDVVLNIALPTMARELKLDATTLPWIVNAYLLCFGGLLLLGGRLADRYGHRTVLLGGVVVFATFSAVGAAAGSAPALILSRGGQGLAAAFLAPAAMSLLVHTFPAPEERSRALGLWGAVTGAGAVIGLVVGGTVTEYVGWRWIFTGNAVVAVLVGISVLALLPGGTGDRRVRIEPLGALLATGGLVLSVAALHGIPDHGWSSPRTIALLGAGLAAVGTAGVVWRRGRDPLVPLALLRDRTVMVSDACGMLVGAAMLGTFYFVSLHLQQVRGYTPVETALAYLPLVAGLAVAAGAGSAAVGRVGPRPVLMTGLATCAVGLSALGTWGLTADRASYTTSLLPGVTIVGLGLGLAFVSLTITAVPNDKTATLEGAASGLYNTALQVGGALGVAVLSTVATSRADALLGSGATASAALAGGRGLALHVGAGLLLAGVALAGRLPSQRSVDTGDHAVGTA